MNEKKSVYDRLRELEDERQKQLPPLGFFESIDMMHRVRAANHAYILNPQSEYFPLLLQDVVNAGQKYIDYLFDEPRKIAEAMFPLELSDDETWMVRVLRGWGDRGSFPGVITGKKSLEIEAMKDGLHPEWIMISTENAYGAVNTIFESRCVSDEYKHEFEMIIAERRFPSTYKTDIRPVDFHSLPAAAKTIKGNVVNINHMQLLAWHLGRVQSKHSTNFRDTEKFLDGVEAALIKARADLAEQQKKEAKKKAESEKRLQVDRKAELEAGLTCVANIETDRELIEWAKSKGLMVYIERKRKKYPEALNGSKWSIYGNTKGWGGEEFWLRAYRERIQEPGFRKEEPLINHIHELKGKLLVGEHYPKPSHGDILAELANAI